MACRVVCISRAMGAGGEEVGRLVADRLGFIYVDEEIVSRTAAKAGIDAGSVADEEQRRSFVTRMLQALAQSGAEALAVGGGPPPQMDDEPTGEAVRVLIRETIEQTAAQGSVVIVAHAASYALPPGPDALRVLVTASPETRAKRLAAGHGAARPRGGDGTGYGCWSPHRPSLGRRGSPRPRASTSQVAHVQRRIRTPPDATT